MIYTKIYLANKYIMGTIAYPNIVIEHAYNNKAYWFSTFKIWNALALTFNV